MPPHAHVSGADPPDDGRSPPRSTPCDARRVYRKDTPDARHTPSFSQIRGGLVVAWDHLRLISAGTIGHVHAGPYFDPNIALAQPTPTSRSPSRQPSSR